MTRIAALLLLTVGLVVGCSGGKPTLPGGPDLLRLSAQAMGPVTSAHLAITVDPAVVGIPVRTLQADLTRTGDAKGSGQLVQVGQLFEIQFVIKGDTLYFKGPTGDFQKLPASTASSVYDTSAVLDPQRGVAKLLATATDATTEAREPVAGRDAFRVHATFDEQVATALVPGISGPLAGAVWVDALTSRPLQARFDVTTSSGKTAPVLVVLSEFNVPVTITPPL